MKIALFTSNLGFGGIQRVHVDMCRVLVERGHEVDLLLLGGPSELASLLPREVNVFMNVGGGRFRGASRKLLEYWFWRKPHAIVASDYEPMIRACESKVLSLGRLRLVLRIDNIYSEKRKAPASAYETRSLNTIENILWIPDRIVAVSRTVEADIRSFSRFNIDKNTRMVYNPCYADDIIKKSIEPVNHPWLKDSNLKIIVGVGRFTKTKNYELLIDAFDRASKLRPDLRLIIVGDGPERNSLQARVNSLGLSDRVDLTGFLLNPYPYVKNADVFAHTATFEGFGLVLIEAAICGTSIVSSRFSVAEEILDAGRLGYLVEPNNVGAMAGQILHALDHPIAPDVLTVVKDIYSMDKFGDALETIVEETKRG